MRRVYPPDLLLLFLWESEELWDEFEERIDGGGADGVIRYVEEANVYESMLELGNEERLGGRGVV